MIRLFLTVVFVLVAGLAAGAKQTVAQTPSKAQTVVPTDTQVRELQDSFKSLQKQLDELSSTKDTASRQRIMQQNWQGMQDYMGRMHDRWGMGYPWMMGNNPSGNWMGGCPMFGSNAAVWPLPGGVDPSQYSQKMREHMQRMQEQMNKIAQTTNTQERQRLLQEHWQTTYQDMQTVRGMGWMWDGYMMGPGMMGGRPLSSAKPLPEANSQGAKLVSTYCIQCHAAPQPNLHSAAEWSSVTQKMHAFMGSGLSGITTPSDAETKTMLSYMQKNAR